MGNEQFLDIKLSLPFLSAYAQYLTFLSSMNGGRDFVVHLRFNSENRKAPPLIWCEELKRETLEKAVLMETGGETNVE